MVRHGGAVSQPWAPQLDRPRSGDAVAGISVALVLIPQSMAYAEIAGVPPYVGLLAASLPLIVAAPFVSSPYLQTGPVALTSLLTFGALSSLATPGTDEYVALAALLALMVGVIRLGVGVTRLGVIAYLMSQPVLMGFTTGAAIVIISSQLPSALGSTPEGDGLLERAAWSLVHPGSWETAAVLLSLLTAALTLGGRRIHRLFPGVLVAVAIGITYSHLADYSGRVVGDLPARLPTLTLDLPYGDAGTLVVGAVVIALVGFAEPASIARTFAAADRIPWSADREFVSQGVANVASAASGGFPIGGSFSRTSLNRFAGGRTRWSGALTGLVVLVFLPFATVMEGLPRAVLGAIVISVVVGLVQPVELARIWRTSPPQAVVAWTTVVATLAFSPRVERAVVLGVVLSLAVHLWRELRVEIVTATANGVLTVHLKGVLYFFSTPGIEQRIIDLLAEHPDATEVVIDLAGVGRLDYTAANVLASVAADAKAAGLEVSLANVPAAAEVAVDRILDD